MKRPAALLIDMDGTILDSEPLHVLAHQQFLASQGVTISVAELYDNVGKGDKEMFARIIKHHRLTANPDAWVLGKTSLLQHILKTQAVARRPGVDRLLATASELNIPCVVVTNSDRETVALALTATGLHQRLPERITADDVTNRKPDPEPYRLAAQRLGLFPDDCWAIEDSPAGIQSAVAAGIGVVWGVPDHIPGKSLTLAGAHRVVGDLFQVAACL